jgi:hypothetical protein
VHRGAVPMQRPIHAVERIQGTGTRRTTKIIPYCLGSR